MIAFRKYHGCGNNFIIFDYEAVKQYDLCQLVIQVCDQHVGIGADGCIIVKQDPLAMLFYNQDGSMAPMCGNGIRCFAKYVCDKHIVKQDCFDVITGAGTLSINVTLDPFQASVSMGEPVFDASLLKLSEEVKDVAHYTIDEYDVSSVFMGTIHTVLFVDQLENIDVEQVGSYLCNHPLYAEKTNLNFVEVVDKDNIKVMTYERGVGITKACGTGCCAAVVIAHNQNKVNAKVNVHLPLGVLHISYDTTNVIMEGPAKFIAEGMYSYQEVA